MLRLVLCAALLALCLPAAAGPGAVTNARIFTMNADQPVVEAMAWDADGRLVFAGSAEGLEQLGLQPEPADLDGRTVVPGLIDAHGHVMGLGLARLQADLVGADNVENVIKRLRERLDDLPADAWLIGRGWDQTLWPEDDFPDRAVLDAAFPDRPVFLVRIDGHAAWANSRALEQAEVKLSGDWQPQGGQIFRDSDGEPTGILIDTAMRLVGAQIPEPSLELREQALELALAEMARLGLTGAHDMGTSLSDFELLRRFERTDRLTARISAYADGDAEMLEWLCENGHYAGPRLTARSVKLYADGALGSRGAALLADYSDDPDNRGLLLEPGEALTGLVNRAVNCGVQVAVHAIGDAANRQAIDALVQADTAAEAALRHRIEHVQIIQPEDRGRMARHAIIASMQPMHATSDMRWAGERLGSERLEHAYVWAGMIDSGIRLALGSDFPVEPANPWLGIHAAVTRQRDGQPPGGWRAHESLSLNQALRGFTVEAAYAGFAEAEVGTLSSGKQADFIVLDADPFAIEAAELAGIKVLQTVVGGQRVFP